MASKPLQAAIFIHFILKLSFFFDIYCIEDQIIKLPSVLILGSVFMMLNEIELVPARFKTIPNFIQTILEVVANIFIIEVAMLVVWARGEEIMAFFLRKWSAVVLKSWSNFFANLLILLIASAVAVHIAAVTGNLQIWINKLKEVYEKYKAHQAMKRAIEAKKKAQEACQEVPEICRNINLCGKENVNIRVTLKC